MTHAGGHDRAPVTRRTMFEYAGKATALAGGVLAGAVRTGVAQAGVSAQSRISGKFQVVTPLDFHPDHNKYIQDTVRAFTGAKGWDTDISDINAYQGGTDIYQRLQAQKAAGTPVDIMLTHSLDARLEFMYDLTRDATPVVQDFMSKFGRPYSSSTVNTFIKNKWVNAPWYTRGEGYWLRKDKFAEVGLDTATDPIFGTWDGMLQAARLVSRPDQGFYGWGLTVNQCGDGDYIVQDIMWQWGGALADPTGEIVTLFSPETIDAMAWMSDVYLNPANRAILPPGVNSWNDTGNNEAWLAGSIGFTFNAATLWAKSILDDTRLPDGTRLDDVTDAVMAPLGPYGARQQRVSGSGFHFMNGSRNFDAAVELANHFMSPEIYDPMLKISYGYVLPAYAAQWDNPFVFENKLARKFKDVVFAEPPFVGLPHRGPPTDAAAAVGQQTVLTGMMGEILAGKPVIAAVRDAHLRCIDIYQAFGLKGR